LKDKVKQSWLYRKYGQYEEAVKILNEALEEAHRNGEQMPISRIYDELANTYYQMGKLEEAERLFRLLIHRLMHMHRKKEEDPEFIGISLKLADIFARTGRIEDAETGYRHCVTKQMMIVEQHMKNFFLSEGALQEQLHNVEVHGPKFTDPLALFGMCLESYAHFLVQYCDESRQRESQEYMDETLKLSYQIYGSNTPHTVTLLNNYGALCNNKNRFESALKYLSIGIERIVQIQECAQLLPGYYCNYAEALFHCGRQDEAIQFAQRALQMAKNADPKVQRYVGDFHKHMLAEHRKGNRRWFLW